MKKIIYILIILSICLIPRTTFASNKINVSTTDDLRNAIESSNDNEIVLNNDINVTYDLSLEDEDNYLIVKAGKHVLNLNNYSIKTDSNSQSDYGLITVLGGSLEIKGDGEVSAPNVVLSLIAGNMTINGGTYISGDENYADIVIMTYSGKLTINKGYFTGNTYAEGPETNDGLPSQGKSLQTLRSQVPTGVIINRNNASKKLGAPLNTLPNITINDGTFNSTTMIYNSNVVINGGNYSGNNAIDISGKDTSLDINDGEITGTDTGLMINTLYGDPSVQLSGGTYTCTECGNDITSFGAITLGVYAEQKDTKELLNSLLTKNATLNDDTMNEGTMNFGNETAYYYYTNKLVKITKPIAEREQKETLDNPETSDNVLLSIITLISSLSIILIGYKQLIKE